MRNFPLPTRLARTGCSVLALATVFIVGASPAAAQSFLATGSPNNGAGTTIANGPGITTISVTAPQTVINWVPTDNATNANVPIVFQASGTTATFLGNGNYAVLNNITATDLSRVISLNGTITSGSLSAAPATGSIYFYSPSGILLGGNSMINVGSLVLSASPFFVDINDNFISGPSNQVIFGQALRSTASITTSAGSTINATGGDAYVAMVAPRVAHRGTINVAGSAALVGAEAAVISFSPDGLFDIQVTAGTTDANGVYNDGNITGSASTGASDIHRAYLVAVPKNTALTMLITTGSDLGFNVAGAANVVGNTVVLSAGHDIVDGAIAGVSSGSTAGAIANLQVTDSNFTSALIGEATGFAHFFAFSALNFNSDVTIHANGEIWFSTQTALGTVDVDGNLTLSTERYGTNGQAVTASLIDVYNLNGAGRITVDGLTTLDTDAYGGDSNVSGINGGNAVGGEIDVVASGGGTIQLLGGLTASADGRGGTALVAGADGGSGTGGDISVRTGSSNGFVTIVGATDLSSSGYGGNGSGGECFACDGDGGAGQGGEIRIYTGDGTGSSLTITGAVDATADGFGGSASSSTAALAGAGTGGVAAYYVGTAGVMTLTGNLSLQADGRGGDHSTANAGAGYGGDAALSETIGGTSGTIAINGNVELSSDGTGGNSFGTGALGGNGFGGTGANGATIVSVYASTTVTGAVNMHSTGTGGNAVNGTGGTGQGGEAVILAQNFVRITGGLTATAEATGGQGAIGGQAEGGDILIRALAGGDLQLLGATNLLSNNATGGTGTSGNGGSILNIGELRFFSNGIGSTVAVSGATTVSSNSLGGTGNGGAGGSARGGDIDVYAQNGGSLTFDDDVTLSASATGGSTVSGIGGNALGGIARLRTIGGTISVGGDLALDGRATGGTGDSGGNATALVSPSTNESLPVAVALYASNGGSITVDGQATLNGSAVGGAGSSGNGGNAAGGEADVVAFVGNINLGGLSVDVTALGGNGGNGGSGGSGQGGAVDVAFGLGSVPINGTITLGSATIMADGFGGSGGVGSNANFGGNGGAGGAGLGGSIGFVGSAAGGTLDSGPAVLTARGTGGQGGGGGNGDSGTGGDGGAGGNGTGGRIQTGTVSQNASPNSGGGVAYSALSINTSARGGNGGNGGSGGGGNGAGGDGGNGDGGRSSFLIRGVLGTADSVTLMANATGGNGGSGSTVGDGGDARTGTIAVESKDRFEVPAERGTLTVGSIVGSAIAIGGSGATAGTSTVVDGSSFQVINGDATIGSVAITLSGDLIDSTPGPSFVSARDGTASIGSFSFVTDGTLSLDANSGAMNAGSITLSASNFVPHIANPAPTNPGTFSANSFDIQTGNNFVTTASLDSVETLTIVAPGAIQIGNVTGDNAIVLNAQGAEVDIGNVMAGGGIDIDALDFIFAGNIVGNGVIDLDAGLSIGTGSILNTGNTSLNAGTSINVGAINSGSGGVSLVTNNGGDISGSTIVGGSIYADSDGDIFLGNLTALDNIELVAIGDILVGNAMAGETIDLDAGGYIDGGTMTAGDSVYASADESIDLLDISAGIVDPSNGYDADYNVGLFAGTTIDTGDIEALNSIGLGAAGDIYTGSIDAGNIFLALGGGNMSFGTINAGQQAYLADDSMIALGGDPIDGDFDPAAITILTPTPSGGSITLRGPVTTGRFVAAAGGALTGTTIDSGSLIYTFSGGNTTLTDLDADTSIYQRSGGVIAENDLDAGSYIDSRSTGGLALGDLVAGDYIDLRSNSAIGLLTATSGETINFQTNGTLTGLTINAGNSVLGQAVGAIQLGNITAGIIDPSSVAGAIYRVGLASNGSITTGAINALGNIGFGTPQNVTTGNLTSGGGILALIGGNASFGAMTTGNDGYVYLANYSMSALGGPFATFNRAPILAQFPVPTGGSIAISGPVTTGNFRAAAGTTFNAGNITSNTNILIDSGGNMTLGNLVAGLTADGSSDAIGLNSNGSIVMGNATALDGIDFDAEGSVTGGNLTSGDEIGGGAGGAIILGNLSGGIVNPQGPSEDGFSVGIGSETSINVGNVMGAESVGFVSLGSITTGTINAGNDFLVMASGNMSFGAINAGGRVYLADSSMYIDAGGDSEGEDEFNAELVFAATPVASGGSITLGAVNAGSFQAAAGTTLTGTTINSNGLLYATSGGNMMLGNLVADDDVRLTSGGNIATGSIYSYDDVALVAAGSISTLDIFAYDDVSGDAGTTISTDDITGNSIELFADGDIATGDLLTQNFFFGQGALALVPGTSITVESGGDVDIGTIDALDGVYVSADGSIVTGTIDADDFVELFAGGNITAGTINAGSYIDILSDTGLLDLNNLTAGTEIDLESEGSLQFGDATADDFNFDMGGSVNGGNIDAISNANGQAEGAIVLENITVTGPPTDGDFSIGFTSATSITVENVDGFDLVGFATLGDLRTGTITAGSLVVTLVSGDIVTGSITTDTDGRVYMADASMCAGACGDDDSDVEIDTIIALAPVPTGGSILINGAVTTGQFQAASGTTLTVDGDISVDTSVSLFSGGAMSIQSVDAGTIALRSDATITGDNLTAGTSVLVEADGAISLDNILAGAASSVLDVGLGSPVEIFGASIVTGTISTNGYVGLYTPGDLSVGSIDAGNDVIALVGDDAAFGAITTPERFFLGGYQMFALVTGGEGFNPGAVFDAQQTSSTGGSATFAGSSSAESFEAYVGDDTTLASLTTSGFAEIDTGGLFTLTGALNSNGYSTVISNDIDIGANASVNNGYLALVSRNASQTLIGDGLDALGQGYRLSDAEADRINTAFSISADTSYGAAAKMIIGDLTIDGGGASEEEYVYRFETINVRDSNNPSVGSIKVVGDVTFSGLGQLDEVVFDTNLFELDAATGSVNLLGQGANLSGVLGLYTPRIWVASGDILARLEANSTYSGYIADLNAPAAVQRPEGVLRAATFDIDSSGEPFQSFLVQNTGTTATPAGFVITDADLGGDDGDFEDAPGSINLVINGQIITAQGTLTGIAVRDLLVAAAVDTASAVAGSTINGCLLVGPCTAAQPTPRVNTPTSTDIPLTGNDGLGDGLFGNEGDIAQGEGGEGGDGDARSSPISPPNPLFDSRPLNQSGDVDDPVSGAGNPSLFGSPDDDEGEDEEKKKKAKAKQGDGK